MEILKAELVDDGAKQDRKGRRIMPPVRIAALVREYEGSGQTLAAFARRAGVNYSTFAGWVYKQRAGANRKEAVRFAQLQLPAPNVGPADLSVTLPDGVVVRGIDSQAVAALVRALRN
jgi:transposase-like protein